MSVEESMSSRVLTVLFAKNISHLQRRYRKRETAAARLRWDRLLLVLFCAAVHLIWISAVIAIFR